MNYNDYDHQNRTNDTASYEPAQQADFSRGGYTAPAQTGKQKQRKKHTGAKLVAVALSCSLLGGVAGAGAAGYVLQNKTGETTTVYESAREASPVSVVRSDTRQALTPAQVYAQNVNSTVGITTSIVTTNYFGYRTAAAASGSGFIISENGYIVTNYHVVDGATSISVALYNGDSFDATLVGYDESNDVAVLKIDASGLTPVVLGDSGLLSVGDAVVAIGNPLGELTFSLTSGVVSALDREITMSDGVTMTLIQTDAAINSGNSGGALFNLYGEVVGITNAKYSNDASSEAGIDNIGFAIPISSVMQIVTDIIEKGYITKSYIGVSLTQTRDGAAAVYSIESGSPAEAAGLSAGDVIKEINGKAVSSVSDVQSAIAATEPGSTAEITILRGGETLTVSVTVGEKQQAALPAQENDEQNAYGGNHGGNYGYGDFPFEFFGDMFQQG